MLRILVSVAFLFVCPVVVSASDPTFKCLLVSVEKYELAPLDYAENDVGKFAQTLMQRYDCQAQACIDSAAMVGESGEDIAKKSIMRKIESWCRSLSQDDAAILYIAGHGVKDETGKLYLAMTNFNRKNFEIAAIPLEWIRDQFGRSIGKSKLLLVDTCFAGTAKSIDFDQANAGDITASFADLKNVVTIASCRGNEKSWLWGDAKHSLFTYWLIEAFKGHADMNGDRSVSCDEIVQYLQNNVPWAASASLEKEQHPVVINESAGESFLLPLRAVALSRLIDDVAEQIDLQMRMEKFARIGVPEFTSGASDSFSPQYGALPRSITDSLRSALALKSRKNKSGYTVLSDNSLRETLQSKGITPSNLGTEKMKEIKINGEDIPLLVGGQLKMFGSGGISLRTKLMQGTNEFGQAGGAAMLNANDLAMTGISAKFGISQSSPPPSPPSLKPEPGVGLVSTRQLADAERMQNAAVQPNPLANTSNATDASDDQFDVWIATRPIGSCGDYVKRPFTFRGNDCFLPLSKGEEYRIDYKASCSDDVFVRIMVDGLNTLSQPRTAVAKGAFVEAADPDSDGEMVVAPRVSLDEARPWFIKNGSNQVFAVTGFVDANGKNDTVQRFRIVDADESVAARKNYTEQLGLITVAFYKATTPSTRGGQIGTSMGNIEKTKVVLYEGGKIPGELLAVYNIRYMTPQTLQQQQNQNQPNR